MVKKLRGVLVGPGVPEAKVMEIDNELEAFYKVLDCDTIDVPDRKIGDKVFSFICDDEGLLKAFPVASAYDRDEKPMLVGKLFVCHTNYISGEFESLSDEDIEYVIKRTQSFMVYSKFGDYPVLASTIMDVDYC